jgi:hypothetical protein
MLAKRLVTTRMASNKQGASKGKEKELKAITHQWRWVETK